ncbi:lipase [Actinomycetospora endophytica]|uniref:Lipase n=1 Tax=Actinomycetospora endophytica TaxID=2291215 RepID=A0ABS8P2Y4_9PSEU|nr:alpha/beta fold hydrolase [Actinomycetospora endophytica]MCD2192610.1 lipase [Actinomycetospora endophytica]
MARRRWSVLVGAAVVVVAMLSAPWVAAAAPAPTPSPAPAVLDPSPPGSNDWSCRPGGAHPNPVVLVHGLSANQADNWGYLAPILARQGYCVFSLTYGRNPLAPPPLSQVGGLTTMEQSAQELKAFVGRVRGATGAGKVDIVGHSEGSLMPNYYVKFLGGAADVDRYVGMTPLWDGTRLLGVSDIDAVGERFGLDPAYGPAVAALCASCREFLHGSPFLQKMNSGGTAAVRGIDYTMIMTRNDELVQPYTSGRLAGAHNVVLQDLCPADLSEHAAVAFDPVNAQLVLDALDPGHARPVHCTGPPR